jgi:hypothetical protein
MGGDRPCRRWSTTTQVLLADWRRCPGGAGRLGRVFTANHSWRDRPTSYAESGWRVDMTWLWRVLVPVFILGILPLLQEETYNWCPYLAKWLVKRAARLVPEAHRRRYSPSLTCSKVVILRPSSRLSGYSFGLPEPDEFCAARRGKMIARQQTTRALRSVPRRPAHDGSLTGIQGRRRPVLISSTSTWITSTSSRKPFASGTQETGRHSASTRYGGMSVAT